MGLRKMRRLAVLLSVALAGFSGRGLFSAAVPFWVDSLSLPTLVAGGAAVLSWVAFRFGRRRERCLVRAPQQLSALSSSALTFTRSERLAGIGAACLAGITRIVSAQGGALIAYHGHDGEARPPARHH